MFFLLFLLHNRRIGIRIHTSDLPYGSGSGRPKTCGSGGSGSEFGSGTLVRANNVGGVDFSTDTYLAFWFCAVRYRSVLYCCAGGRGREAWRDGWRGKSRGYEECFSTNTAHNTEKYVPEIFSKVLTVILDWPEFCTIAKALVRSRVSDPDPDGSELQ